MQFYFPVILKSIACLHNIQFNESNVGTSEVVTIVPSVVYIFTHASTQIVFLSEAVSVTGLWSMQECLWCIIIFSNATKSRS